MEWLNGQFKHNEYVELKEREEVVMQRNMTLAGVIIGFALFVYLIYNVLMDQRIWFFVAMMAHLICTGGVVYGIQNDMPWFKYQKGKNG